MITRIDVYQVEYALLEGSYAWSGGHAVTSFTSSIVKLSTDAGLAGYGEVCPLGSAYMEAYAGGVPSGVAEIAPLVLGADPCRPHVLASAIDAVFTGHLYVKSPIDIACWDLFGQASGMPVAELLGGRYADDYPLYRAISQQAPDRMAESVRKYREEGYRRFQLKVGSDVETDIGRIAQVLDVLQPGDILVADANTGWHSHQAIRIVDALAGRDFYLEQPCPTLEECLRVRAHTDRPMVLDEIITGVGPLVRAHEARAMDVVNIKISKFGGLTKAKQARDLCVSLGVVMTLEDSWGGDIVTAAIAHLAHSTPPEFLFTSTDFNSYVTTSIADGAPKRVNGRMAASTAPGLGVTPRMDVLGEPVLQVP